MHHPNTMLLQSYLDGELDPDQLSQIERHVEACSRCLTRIEELDRIAQAIRDTRPVPHLFCCEAAFWNRVASRLGGRGMSSWTWLAYLPPVLLVTIVVVIQSGAAMMIALMTLARLRVVPSAQAILHEPVDTLLKRSLLMDIATSQGWLDQESGHNVLLWWEQQSQQGWIAMAVLVLSSLAVTMLLALGFSWFACWIKAGSGRREGGR